MICRHPIRIGEGSFSQALSPVVLDFSPWKFGIQFILILTTLNINLSGFRRGQSKNIWSAGIKKSNDFVNFLQTVRSCQKIDQLTYDEKYDDPWTIVKKNVKIWRAIFTGYKIQNWVRNRILSLFITFTDSQKLSKNFLWRFADSQQLSFCNHFSYDMTTLVTNFYRLFLFNFSHFLTWFPILLLYGVNFGISHNGVLACINLDIEKQILIFKNKSWCSKTNLTVQTEKQIVIVVCLLLYAFF